MIPVIRAKRAEGWTREHGVCNSGRHIDERCRGGSYMARYGKAAAKRVKSAMHRRKRGTLKSGRSGKRVTSRKQAIAIGLSEAREKGAKVPRKRGTRRRTSSRRRTRK
jgi:hypothetical protein